MSSKPPPRKEVIKTRNEEIKIPPKKKTTKRATKPKAVDEISSSALTTPPTFISEEAMQEIMSKVRNDLLGNLVTKEEFASKLQVNEEQINTRLKFQIPIIVNNCVNTLHADDQSSRRDALSLIDNTTTVFSKQNFIDTLIEVTKDIDKYLAARFPRFKHAR